MLKLLVWYILCLAVYLPASYNLGEGINFLVKAAVLSLVGVLLFRVNSMKTMRTHLSERRFIVFAIVCLCVLKSAYTLAAPGKLSDVPLFLSGGVKPNVLFVIDEKCYL